MTTPPTSQPSREELGKMAYQVDIVNEDGMPLWDELPSATRQSYINTSSYIYQRGRKDAEAEIGLKPGELREAIDCTAELAILRVKLASLRARLVKLHADLGWLKPRWPDSQPMTDDEKRVTDDFYLSHFAAPEADNPPLDASTSRENAGPGAASLSAGAAKPEVTEEDRTEGRKIAYWFMDGNPTESELRFVIERLAAHTAKALEKWQEEHSEDLDDIRRFTKRSIEVAEHIRQGVPLPAGVWPSMEERAWFDAIQSDLASSLRRETMLNADVAAGRRYSAALRKCLKDFLDYSEGGASVSLEDAYRSTARHILDKTAADFDEPAKEESK